jgi:hypothetical protein
MKISRRGFLVLGASSASVTFAAGKTPYDPMEHYRAVDVKLPLEDNLLKVYLKPTPI